MFQIQNKDQRVLSGGLNLIAPADLTQEGGAVSLDNFRVDQIGNIRSRYGRNSIATYTGYINGINLKGAGRYVTNTAGTLYLNGSSIDSGYDSDAPGVVSFLGYAWIMNKARQKRTPGGSTIESWLPAAPADPTLTDSAGGELVEGQTYTWWITWVTADGQETNPNPTATMKTITTGNGVVAIARPSTTDARVTGWNVYRDGNTLPDAYRVNADVIPYATTSYTDDGAIAEEQDDLSLTRLGIALETDHDDPPAATGLAGPYYGKLIAWATAAHTNWIYWTDTNRPYMWPGSGLDEGNHAPVGEDGDIIYDVRCYARHLRIYTKYGIWRITGDPDDLSGDMQQISVGVSLVGPKAICSAGGIDYIECAEGIYACDGERAAKISKALDPLFKGEAITIDGAKPATPVTTDPAVRLKHCMAHRNGRIYFSYAEEGQSQPNRTLVYDIASKVWCSDDRGWTALADEGASGDLLGASIGVLFALEYPDVANAIAVDYRSAVFHQGTADRQKTYVDIVIEHSVRRDAAAGETLDVTAYYDFGADSDSLGTITTATTAATGVNRLRTTLRVPTDERTARNIQIGIAGSVKYDVSIYSIDVHYYVHPRDAATYDSGITNLGVEQVKQIDIIEVDIANTADVAYELTTDIPGGALASRKTGTITTGDRRVVTIQLTTGTSQVDGRLVRFTLACASGTFRRYGTRFRVRPVGVYRDGANGEIWTTQESGVGI